MTCMCASERSDCLRSCRCCIESGDFLCAADDMGLGKTLSMVSLILASSEGEDGSFTDSRKTDTGTRDGEDDHCGVTCYSHAVCSKECT